MISLGVIERWGFGNFSGYRPKAMFVQLLLELSLAGACLGELVAVEAIDCGAVLGAGVVTLAHALLV